MLKCGKLTNHKGTEDVCLDRRVGGLGSILGITSEATKKNKQSLFCLLKLMTFIKRIIAAVEELISLLLSINIS